MTKVRNAVLAGVLAAGIGGAGVLTAAPAFAAQVATPAGSLISATGKAGTDLDFAMTGPAWTLSENQANVTVDLGTLPGVEFRNSFNGVPGTEIVPGDPSKGFKTTIGDVGYVLAPNAVSKIWYIRLEEAVPGNGADLTTVTIPTLKIGQTTTGAQQTVISLNLRATTNEIQPSAVFTWTEDQSDTPVIAPAIGGAAAIAGIGLAGIVLVRRRRNAEQA